VKIITHIAPSPMELLANITVKLESDAELGVEIVAHKQPTGTSLMIHPQLVLTGLEQLANITVKTEPMDESA
jgi:hypothetical protein